MKFKLQAFIVCLVLVFMAVPAVVLGQDATSTPKPLASFSPRPVKPMLLQDRTFSPKPLMSPGAALVKLTDQSLRSCQAREAAIKNRTDSLLRMVSNMLGKHDAILARVQEFYTNKVLPSGKSVPNYDELLADIADKKAAVQTSVDSLPDVSGFDCESDDPKGMLADFRTDMQSLKQALADYRTSIKNLIVAIHGVFGTPKPSATPSPTP